jgi:hypothetical protein
MGWVARKRVFRVPGLNFKKVQGLTPKRQLSWTPDWGYIDDRSECLRAVFRDPAGNAYETISESGFLLHDNAADPNPNDDRRRRPQSNRFELNGQGSEYPIPP